MKSTCISASLSVARLLSVWDSSRYDECFENAIKHKHVFSGLSDHCWSAVFLSPPFPAAQLWLAVPKPKNTQSVESHSLNWSSGAIVCLSVNFGGLLPLRQTLGSLGLGKKVQINDWMDGFQNAWQTCHRKRRDGKSVLCSPLSGYLVVGRHSE